MKCKLLTIILIVICLNNCHGTLWNEKLLPDGITWRVTVAPEDWPFGCGITKYTAVKDECLGHAKSLINRKAFVLCGKKPERIFACSGTILYPSVGVTCNVRCKKNVERKIIQTSSKETPAPPPLTRKEKIERAKKCQKKGGVYIEGKCEIEID